MASDLRVAPEEGQGVYLDADAAADLLGVRLQTVYAYVSRGLLHRRYVNSRSGHRVSAFDRDEVRRLAARRTRARTGLLDVLVETQVTRLDPKGRLLYRGQDVAELVDEPFEQVAELVWGTTELGAPDDGSPWGGGWSTDDDERVRRVVAALPHGSTATDRIRAVVVALGAGAEGGPALEADAVLGIGRRAVLGAVAAVAGGRRTPPGGVAARLWWALTGRDARPRELAALEAAMVLLVDHELAASTMAVRVAAGTGAGPWLALLAGLAALSGPAHGRHSLSVESLLTGVDERGLAALEEFEPPAGLPGFGHQVYLDADPRAELLLDRVASLDPAGWPLLESVLLAVSASHQASPNVDFALAGLVRAAALPPGSGEVVFAVSRMVGWLAHAMEEYPLGLRFRPRALYAGD